MGAPKKEPGLFLYHHSLVFPKKNRNSGSENQKEMDLKLASPCPKPRASCWPGRTGRTRPPRPPSAPTPSCSAADPKTTSVGRRKKSSSEAGAALCYLRVASISILNPGILLSRKPQTTWGNSWFSKRAMVEKNGESTPRLFT